MVNKISLSKRIVNNKLNTLEMQLKPKLPTKNMLIEINNVCNHKCIFCSNRKVKREAKFIDEALLVKILNDAFDNGVKEVGYYMSGEPFLNKNLAKYIKLAKDIGYEYVYITTNGALAKLDNVIPCLKAGLDSIKFSINASNAKDYKFIHGVDDFDKVIENLKNIFDYRKENNLKFNIFTSTIVTQQTLNCFKELEVQVKDYVDEMVGMNVMNQGGMLSDAIESLYVEKDFEQRTFCEQPFKAINITSEGYLTACCTDFYNYLIIADLNETSLVDAWNSDAFIKLRRRFIEKNLEGTICYNCLNDSCSKFEPTNKKYADLIDLDSFYKDNDFFNRIEDIN